MPLIAAVVSHRFEDSGAGAGPLLVLGALLSGLARRSFVSLTAVFVIAGFILGDGVIGALHFDARSGFVSELATVALIVILFRDGLEVEGEMLQSALAPPVAQARPGDADHRRHRGRWRPAG